MNRTDSERRSAWLGLALDGLNSREQFINRERRLREDGSTLASLGDSLGISKERVRQIENAALAKLRDHLTANVGDPHEAGLLPDA